MDGVLSTGGLLCNWLVGWCCLLCYWFCTETLYIGLGLSVHLLFNSMLFLAYL
jgi:hypothetical protein